MKISLIRHGRPAVDLKTRITGALFAEWLGAYAQAGIDPSLAPPRSLPRALTTCTLVVTSPATRAIESANILGLSARRMIGVDAVEAPLPGRLYCPVPLRPTTFCVWARIVWLLGADDAGENVAAVRARAQRLIELLASLAAQHGHIALIGHGYMNRFVGRALRSAGWQSPIGRQSAYWSCAHFELPDCFRRPQAETGPATRS